MWYINSIMKTFDWSQNRCVQAMTGYVCVWIPCLGFLLLSDLNKRYANVNVVWDIWRKQNNECNESWGVAPPQVFIPGLCSQEWFRRHHLSWAWHKTWWPTNQPGMVELGDYLVYATEQEMQLVKGNDLLQIVTFILITSVVYW